VTISWWWRVTKEWVVVLNYEKCTKNGPNRTKYGVDSDTPSDDYQVSSLVLGHIHILCCLRSCLEMLCKYISRVCTRPMVYQDSCESSNTPKLSINNHDFLHLMFDVIHLVLVAKSGES